MVPPNVEGGLVVRGGEYRHGDLLACVLPQSEAVFVHQHTFNYVCGSILLVAVADSVMSLVHVCLRN